jgi:hypothetical protein
MGKLSLDQLRRVFEDRVGRFVFVDAFPLFLGDFRAGLQAGIAGQLAPLGLVQFELLAPDLNADFGAVQVVVLIDAGEDAIDQLDHRGR